MNKQLTVLISAYACEPYKGSEPGAGWNWIKQISRFHKAYVITRENNRGPIEKALLKEPMPNVVWVYYDLPEWVKLCKKKLNNIHFYYYLWQIGIYFIARRLHKEINFDLVHHITFASYWMPSFLSFLSPPFIWGPVGSADSVPVSFYKTFNFKGKFLEYSRYIFQRIGENNPFTRYTARQASRVFATTYETKKRLKKMNCKEISLLLSVALTEEEIDRLKEFPIRTNKPFRIVSVGNLLVLKGFHLGLAAFAIFQQKFPDSEYWIIGGGPEKENLKLLCKKLNVYNNVFFLDNLPRHEVLQKLIKCDILLQPSFHDSGTYVCAEAMASGRPVICLNLGGQAIQINEETGFKIPAITPEQTVNDIAEAIFTLANNPELRISMGEAGRKMVIEHFNWTKRGEFIDKVYNSVIFEK